MTVVESLKQRIENLEREVALIYREKHQEQYPALQDNPREVFLCETYDNGSYPSSPATVYPIRFLDGTFTETAGTQTLTKTAHSATNLRVGYNDATFISSGTVCQAWRQNKRWYIIPLANNASGGTDTRWLSNVFYDPEFWWYSGADAGTVRATTDYIACTFEAPYDDATIIWKKTYGPDIGITFDSTPSTELDNILLSETGFYKFDFFCRAIPFRVDDSSLSAPTANYQTSWQVTFQHHVATTEASASSSPSVLWYKTLASGETAIIGDIDQIEFFRQALFTSGSYGDSDLSGVSLYTTETYAQWINASGFCEYFNIPASSYVTPQMRARASKPADGSWGYDGDMGYIIANPQLIISKMIPE